MLSPTTRLKHPRSLKKSHLWRALVVEAETSERHDHYSIRTSPKLWNKVFVRVYRTPPEGPKDPRWDPLFKTGFQLVEMLGK